MAHYYLRSVVPLPQELGGLYSHIPVAHSVEAVAAYPEFLIILIGNAVKIGLLGYRMVIGGIEDSHHIRIGKQVPAGPYSHEVDGVMYGCEGFKPLYILSHLGSDIGRAGIFIAPVYDTVTYGLYLGKVRNNSVLLVGYSLEDYPHGHIVIGQVDIPLVGLVTLADVFKMSALSAYPLAKSVDYHLFCFGFDKSEFQ